MSLLLVIGYFVKVNHHIRTTYNQYGAKRIAASVDSAWEQKKLEARKLFKNAQPPTIQVRAVLLE